MLDGISRIEPSSQVDVSVEVHAEDLIVTLDKACKTRRV